MTRRRRYGVSADVLEFDPELVKRLTRNTDEAIFGNDPDQPNPALNALRLAWVKELTPCQRQYLTLYYSNHMTMTQIAAECGVNVSTVCRTLSRGRNRLRRVLQYYFM